MYNRKLITDFCKDNNIKIKDLYYERTTDNFGSWVLYTEDYGEFCSSEYGNNTIAEDINDMLHDILDYIQEQKDQTDLEILFNFAKTFSKESKPLDIELQKILNDNFKKLW